MAYVQFEDAVPVASGTINELCTDTRNNLEAVRDAVVMGTASGWGYTKYGGTADQPAEIRYSKGNQRIKSTLTWGTSGGADGNVRVAAWAYTADHTAGTPVYDAIGTETISYDADANVVSTVWS
jgi:hypothetical protein